MDIILTASAQKFMRRMVRFSGRVDAGFRLTVSTGGCSGFVAAFTIEAAPLSGDSTVVRDDLIIFLPAETGVLMDGGTLDCTESGGLVFVNPKAANCGCGSSLPGRGGKHASTISIASIQRRV